MPCCRGDTVYVHCKAGRGRSTAIVLCYLIKHCGLTYVLHCAVHCARAGAHELTVHHVPVARVCTHVQA
ncbi:hypothetical protein EON66_01655 [archaeon]|nr:MAG: hypothetical protein EON66_01655 [archaeon]